MARKESNQTKQTNNINIRKEASLWGRHSNARSFSEAADTVAQMRGSAVLEATSLVYVFIYIHTFMYVGSLSIRCLMMR